VQVVHACKFIFLVFEIRRIINPGQSGYKIIRLPHLRERNLGRVGIPVILVTSKKHKQTGGTGFRWLGNKRYPISKQAEKKMSGGKVQAYCFEKVRKL
jgi:hypothetical protein